MNKKFELHEVKCHLHYADDSNDVSLKSFIVAADAIIKKGSRLAE